MKEHFKKLPTITKIEVGGKLKLYVSMSVKIVAAILLMEKDKA